MNRPRNPISINPGSQHSQESSKLNTHSNHRIRSFDELRNSRIAIVRQKSMVGESILFFERKKKMSAGWKRKEKIHHLLIIIITTDRRHC